MKTKLFFLLFALISISSVFSQENIWFEEQFDNNKKGWMIGSDQDDYFELSIEDGMYCINLKHNIDFRWYFKCHSGVFIDPSKDFTIETSLLHNSGNSKSGYGIVWASEDEFNCLSFTICTKGKYKVSHIDNGRERKIQNWTQTEYIKPSGEFNKLKIKGSSGKMKFFINDKEVFETEFIPFIGTKIGFEANRDINVKADYYIIRQENEINIVPELEKNIKIENLGKNINSKYSEKVPVISADARSLYFAVSGDSSNVGIIEHDDIWYSQYIENTWQPRINIGKPLNNNYSNFVISVSPDNNSLYLSGQYDQEGKYKSDGISVSYRTRDGWSIPKDVVINDFYNNARSQSFCFSADGRTLISSIQRDDNYGGLDFYVSFLKKDGTWSKPENMGAAINSFGNEITPFLAADNVTLFFSTDGRPGFGDADIFQSRRKGDGWTSWSEPQNLGSTINTVDWDAYYTLPASGEFAIMVSYQNSFGLADILKIKLPEAAKPDAVVLLYGKVLNSKTKEPIEAKIIYRNLETDEEIGSANSDPNTGEYKIVLPAGNNYSFRATKEQFIAVSDYIELPVIEEYVEIEKDLFLTPIEVGLTVRLNNIFFDFGKATLRVESYPELNRVVKLLNENENMQIEIGGHTDNKGSDEFNLHLSQQRANMVRQYIIEKSIQQNRITSKGYGETKPTASNETEKGRQNNRRVEFTIIKK